MSLTECVMDACAWVALNMQFGDRALVGRQVGDACA
jgi:hypothetical protein